MGCTFCDKQYLFESRQFYTGDHWWAALDTNPITPGNSLLVYKGQNCCQNILDAPHDALVELGPALQQASQAIKEYFDEPSALSRYQELEMIDKKRPGRIRNVFVVALGEGANTKHLHFHLIPYFDCHRDEKGQVEGKMMSWLGERELLRDGALEQAISAGIPEDKFRSEKSSELQLPEAATALKQIIDRERKNRLGQ